jgi:hypothetical protein
VVDVAGGDAAAVLGTLLAIKMFTFLLVGPLAPAIARRIGTKRLLVLTDITRVLIAVSLPFVDNIAVAYLLIFLPWCGYYLYRLWEICHRPQDYVLYEAVAKKAYPALGRKIYFEVEITHPDGSTEVLETKSVFSLSILTNAYWGEIQGQRLRILYDAAAWRVVAVDRIEEK